MENKYADVKTKLSQLLSRLIETAAVSFGAICKSFMNGFGHPMALLLFRLLCDAKGADWLEEELKSAKITCTDVLLGNVVMLTYATVMILLVNSLDCVHYDTM